MANEHFHKLSIFDVRHLSNIKAATHRLKAILEDSDERQSVFTSFYQVLWDTLQKDFEDLDQPANKKAKTTSDEGELRV